MKARFSSLAPPFAPGRAKPNGHSVASVGSKRLPGYTLFFLRREENTTSIAEDLMASGTPVQSLFHMFERIRCDGTTDPACRD